jgi:hypothetical protein
MNLIEVLSHLFDSFSLLLEDLIGVGTIKGKTWYVYLITPDTRERIDSLFSRDLLLCPRDRDLFVNMPCNNSLYAPLYISEEDLQDLKEEVYMMSIETRHDSMSFGKDFNNQLEAKCLELNMGF